MLRIAYVSQATEKMEEAQLNAILSTARTRNTELDITGFLVFDTSQLL